MSQLTENFRADEFQCRCYCGFDSISLDLVRKLQIIRDIYREPMPINSGCRCHDHNKYVKGFKDSYHMKGLAADIKIGIANREGRVLIVREALRLGLTVGLSNFFIHLDNRNAQRIFTY